jgi:hypothetical protein
MATVTTRVHASPGQVFDVLSDGWYYATWVVGTSHVRAVETGWPAVGSRLFHASGVWPATICDETRVEECVVGQRLVMLARGRPMGEARVEMTLAGGGGETIVTMTETPVSGPGRWLHNPLAEGILLRRNTETLARLAALAERRSAPAD